MQKTLFMAAWDMDVEKGGVNKVMLRRSYLLQGTEYRPVLLTMDFKTNYDEIQRELRATGQLHPHVQIVNIHDYYCDKYRTNDVSAEERRYFEESRKKFEGDYWVEDAGTHARYFDNGRYVKYKRWDDEGFLKVVDYFDENRVRIRREEFHISGYKCRETLYHPANNKKNQERYFTPNGFCYLTYWFNHTTGNMQRVFLFDPKYTKANDFKNRAEFQTYWLTELCRLESVKPIIIVDGAATSERVVEVDDEYVDKVFVIHGNHFMAPYTLGSEYRKAIQPILEAIPKGYATVVLTEAQRKDIHIEIGNRCNDQVIPNTVQTDEPKVERNPHVFSIVSRLVENKRINHAIEAISRIVDDYPSVQLNIYGVGDELDNLKALIEKLNLQNNVRLVEYTNRVDEVYCESAATIIASAAEGLSLVMQESFINGTPVIAYDVNYGPAQYVENGKNGYLVENGNIDELAHAMKEVLSNPQKAEQLGKNARAYALEAFDEELYTKRWRDLLRFAVEKGPKKQLID